MAETADLALSRAESVLSRAELPLSRAEAALSRAETALFCALNDGFSAMEAGATEDLTDLAFGWTPPRATHEGRPMFQMLETNFQPKPSIPKRTAQKIEL